MATPQAPLGSGFGRTSEPEEVLDGIDLAGRHVVITGGYSGLGLETTRALVGAGARVSAPARRPDHASQVFADEGIDGVTVGALDLGDLESVAAYAASVLDDGSPIDLMIDNAAIMACPETRVGPGWEAQFATNHLGHFALVNRLWPLIAAAGGADGARVVSLSSTGHKRSPMRWDDVDFRQGYEKWEAYGQAKTANSLFAVHLDRLGAPGGVRAFAVHPGGIMTPLQRHLDPEEMKALGWIDDDGNAHEMFKSPTQGCTTTLWAATSPLLDGHGGVYCEDCDIAVPHDPEHPFARAFGVMDHAVDPGEAERLWALSAERTGVDSFA